MRLKPKNHFTTTWLNSFSTAILNYLHLVKTFESTLWITEQKHKCQFYIMRFNMGPFGFALYSMVGVKMHL